MPERRGLVAALLALVCGLVLGGCAGATGRSEAPTATRPVLAAGHSGSVHLSGGWVSAIGTGSSMSAAYAVLGNDASTPDALVSVSAGRGWHAALHQTTASENGSSDTMSSVRSIAVPAHGQARLTPGADHVMLSGGRGRLTPGSELTLTWHFRSGRVIRVAVPVLSPEDRP